LRVFPLDPRSKEPNGGLVPHGAKDSTTDPAKVRAWWKHEPSGNIGVHGGTIVDCDHGITSFEEAECWRTLCGLPATLAVRTGRRPEFGVQYHFSGQTKTGPYEHKGVSGEIRSGNNYGLWQGSIHPDTGEKYQIVCDLPFAVWPPASALEENKRKIDEELGRDPATLDGAKIGRTKRQYWLVKQCGRLRFIGLSGAALFNALRALCDACCEYPEEKTDAMLRQICESGERLYGVTQPTLDSRPEVAALLDEFNSQYFMVQNFGGKCRVCSEVENPAFSGSFYLTNQTFEDFRNAHLKRKVRTGTGKDGEPQYRAAADVWLKHEFGRQYAQVIYAPGANVPENIRNLWRGFRFAPVKGNCGLYLEHLRYNICKRKKVRFDWLIKWMAYAVRNPGEPGHTALVLKGSEGCRKNSAADPFAMLWGSHHLILNQSHHVTGKFNAHLRQCSMLVANEAFFAGDPTHVGPLKGLITDSMLPIEAKGVDVTHTRNLLHIIICSNEDWVVPAGMEARRFTVFHCGNAHRNDTEYFGALWAELKNGGFEALLYHLLNEVELTGFSPRQHLPTEELTEQKEHSLRGMDSLWFECLQRGQLPFRKITAASSVLLRASDLVEWAAKKNRGEWNRIRTEHVGHLFKKMNFEKTRDVQIRVFVIPALDEARSIWNQKQFAVEWDEGCSWTADL
jgi:hypothetical protein